MAVQPGRRGRATRVGAQLGARRRRRAHLRWLQLRLCCGVERRRLLRCQQPTHAEEGRLDAERGQGELARHLRLVTRQKHSPLVTWPLWCPLPRPSSVC
jgi:hypothetical protein